MMETQRTIHQRHPLLMAGLAFVSTALLPLPFAESEPDAPEDTVQFISDMANTHGFVRTSCRNPKGKPDENH